MSPDPPAPPGSPPAPPGSPLAPPVGAPAMLPAPGATDPPPAPVPPPPVEVPAIPATRVDRRRAHRIRTAVVAAVSLTVVAAMAVLSVVGSRAILSSRAGRSVTAAGGRLTAFIPPSQAGLLVLTDADDRAAGYLIVALTPEGRGGTLILVPTRLVAPIPGTGEEGPLGDAYAAGGLDLARQAVEQFLGVTLTSAEVVGPASLAGLLRPAMPVTVDLPVRLSVTDDDGGRVTLFERGEHRLDAAEAVQFVTARPVGELETERMARLLPFWDAVVRNLAGPGAPAATSTTGTLPPDATTTTVAPPPDAAGYLALLASGRFVVDQVPLVLLEDPDAEEDTYGTDQPYLKVLVAQSMPSRVSPASGGSRVRLVNPFGDQSLTVAAGGRLTFLGANLVMATTVPADPPQRTVVEYVLDVNRLDAEFLAEQLGGGEVRQSDQVLEGIDITITLGGSFRDLIERQERASATTTSTTGRP